MNKFYRLLLLTGILACNSSTEPKPPDSTAVTYSSQNWDYSYIAPGYSEGLDSVTGNFLLVLDKDSLAILSQYRKDILGYFWTNTVGQDTLRFPARIWPGTAQVLSRYFVGVDSVLTLVDAYPSTTIFSHPAGYFKVLTDSTILFSISVASQNADTTVHIGIHFKKL